MREFTQLIADWLQSVFSNGYLTTAVISVIPTIEVRGAITVGATLGLNPWIAYVLSCCSALLVCPILLLCLLPILRALKKTKAFRTFASAVEETFKKKADKIDADAQTEDIAATDDAVLKLRKKRFNKILGIFLFVAIPIPLTGVWTGSAVAAFVDLEYRYSVPAIVIGNFFAGLIITVLNIILGEFASLILLVLLLFATVSVVSLIVTFIIKYIKIKKEKSSRNEKSNV